MNIKKLLKPLKEDEWIGTQMPQDYNGKPLKKGDRVFYNRRKGTITKFLGNDIVEVEFEEVPELDLMARTDRHYCTDLVKCDESKMDSLYKSNKDFNNIADDYMMLDRLKEDCEYFLGYGNGTEKYLWAHSVEDQIALMKEIYARLEQKPNWINMEDIEKYEKDMLAKKYGDKMEESIFSNLNKNLNKALDEEELQPRIVQKDGKYYGYVKDGAGSIGYSDDLDKIRQFMLNGYNIKEEDIVLDIEECYSSLYDKVDTVNTELHDMIVDLSVKNANSDVNPAYDSIIDKLETSSVAESISAKEIANKINEMLGK